MEDFYSWRVSAHHLPFELNVLEANSDNKIYTIYSRENSQSIQQAKFSVRTHTHTPIPYKTQRRISCMNLCTFGFEHSK